MNFQRWILSTSFLAMVGCALPTELQEAGDRLVYVFDGEGRVEGRASSKRDSNSDSGAVIEKEAIKKEAVEVSEASLTKKTKQKQDVEPSKIAQKKVQKVVQKTASKDDSPKLPLVELGHDIKGLNLPSIYEVKPEANAPKSTPNLPAYKVIRVGEEEIRVLDKAMGVVEKSDLERLRSQTDR